MTKSGLLNIKPGDFSASPKYNDELKILYDIINNENLWNWIKNFNNNKLDSTYRYIRMNNKFANLESIIFDEIFSQIRSIATYGWDDYVHDLTVINEMIHKKGWNNNIHYFVSTHNDE